MKSTGHRSARTPSGSPRYAGAVPAVVRALDVIGHLHGVPDGLTLSEIGRSLRISPSSLSAILRTLVSRGYLARDDTNGRYQLGAALGKLASEGTSWLAIRDAADAVAAMTRASIAVSGHGGPSDTQRETLVALGLAGHHLSDLLLRDNESGVSVGGAFEPVWQNAASGPLATADLDRFLAGGWIATLSCLKENGYPYSVPVWYHWEDGRFWVVPRARAEWARYLELDPRVSLAISEHHPPLRRVLVEGKAEPASGPDRANRAVQLTARMAQRYLGPSATSYLAATTVQTHRVFAIVPEKLVTWHGLASHPRYQSPDPRPTDGEGVA